MNRYIHLGISRRETYEAFFWFGGILGSASRVEFPVSLSNHALPLDCSTAALTTPQKVLPIWKLVELKMLDFSDRTRAGISILTSVAEALIDYFFLFFLSFSIQAGRILIRTLCPFCIKDTPTLVTISIWRPSAPGADGQPFIGEQADFFPDHYSNFRVEPNSLINHASTTPRLLIYPLGTVPHQ